MKSIFSCKIRIGTHFFVVEIMISTWAELRRMLMLKIVLYFMEAQNNLLDQIILRTVMITFPQ